jgi:predicted transcriptional regulator
MYVSILETIAQESKKKTRIMFAANINYEQLRLYLPELMRMNFINYDAETRHYCITEKGRQFLAAYHTIDAMLKNNHAAPTSNQDHVI